MSSSFLAHLAWVFFRISVGRVPCVPDSSLLCVSNDSRDSSYKSAPSPSLYYLLTHWIQIGTIRSIRVDHTNCLQVAIKTHSFINGSCLQLWRTASSITHVCVVTSRCSTYESSVTTLFSRKVWSVGKGDNLLFVSSHALQCRLSPTPSSNFTSPSHPRTCPSPHSLDKFSIRGVPGFHTCSLT